MPGRLLEMATLSPQDANASATKRRSSGRVRKQPEMYNSSPFIAGGGKRKRSNEEEGDDDGDDGEMPDGSTTEESEDDEEPEEADEEEIREQRKKARKAKNNAPKKPTQKKFRVNGASLPLRGATGGKTKRLSKKSQAINTAQAAEAGGLFAEVFASGMAFEDIAGTWLRRSGQHESSALAEVINLVLRCAGCTGQVTEHDMEEPDGATNRLEDLREEYQATEPTDYPLIARGKKATSVREGLTGFFHALVKALAVTGVLYNNTVLMENIQVWISTMSSAPNRSFRHTSTVAALSVVTALCEVAHENAEDVAANQRHAETERKKARANQARVKQIQQKVKEARTAQEFVEPQLEDWFNVLFIHRSRDVDPAIRRDCISALGDWMIIHPDVFFDSNHLRYMTFAVSDTSPATRGEAIQQLRRLYSEKDELGVLKRFTEKFRPRMVEIATTDADTNVRVSGIELLESLRENGLLEPDDIDAVGRLIYDTEARVRKTVATFFSENVDDTFNGKVDELGGPEGLEEAMSDAGEGNYDVPKIEWLKYKSLAELLQSYDTYENLPNLVERNRHDGSLTLFLGNVESRFTLAASVLYEKVEEIKEWQMLAGYLLFDHSAEHANDAANDSLSQLKQECVLTEREEAILLEVLQASVKQALLVMDEKINGTKSKLTKKQKEQLEEEQEEAARRLATLVPKLLKKFGDAPGTAAAVLRIESILSLPSLRHLRQDSATYGALLDDVRRQFMSHSTDEVLAPASSAILHAKSYGELDDLAEEKLNHLWDDVIGNLTDLLKPATITVRGSLSLEELTALSNNLLRIVRLSAVSDCSPHLEDSSVATSNNASGTEYQGAIDYIIALVQRAVPSTGPAPDHDEATVEDEIAARASEATLFYCRWKLRSIISSVTTAGSTGVPFEELEALATRRDNYVDNIKSALQSRKAGEDVSIVLTGCLLDLYSSAAILKEVKPLPGLSDDYTVLGMDLDGNSQKLVMHVFAACERNFAKLSGKKLEQVAVNGMDPDDADVMDDDLLSEPESDEEEAIEVQFQGSQQRKEAKALSTLLAEQKLCALTGKIIHAVLAGVVAESESIRERLVRNRAKLGHNFKEVVAYLNISALEKKVTRSKGKGTKLSKAGRKANPKSNAIVAEDELDDEIEDIDDPDQEALKRQGLLADGADEPDAEQLSGEDGRARSESVVGD